MEILLATTKNPALGEGSIPQPDTNQSPPMTMWPQISASVAAVPTVLDTVYSRVGLVAQAATVTDTRELAASTTNSTARVWPRRAAAAAASASTANTTQPAAIASSAYRCAIALFRLALSASVAIRNKKVLFVKLHL